MGRSKTKGARYQKEGARTSSVQQRPSRQAHPSSTGRIDRQHVRQKLRRSRQFAIGRIAEQATQRQRLSRRSQHPTIGRQASQVKCKASSMYIVWLPSNPQPACNQQTNRHSHQIAIGRQSYAVPGKTEQQESADLTCQLKLSGSSRNAPASMNIQRRISNHMRRSKSHGVLCPITPKTN